MFTQTWKKYLPVIIMLIKRSASGPQTLQTNASDFERAAGGRKLKFNFSNMEINKGRQNYSQKLGHTANDLLFVLLENDAIAALLKKENFLFSMGNDMLLTITNATAATVASSETADVVEKGEAV